MKKNKYLFDCNKCLTKCDGKSKELYIFKNDIEFAEEQENIIINKLKEKGKNATKCKKKTYPDIVIKNDKGKILYYIEVKAQRRTFMSVKYILKNANLNASETLALNLSDLLRYFSISKKDKVNIYIVWVLQNRPCIVPSKRSLYFIQNITNLEKIYNNCKNKRIFKRKSGKGDIVNGIHKGVVVNYHFSLNELKQWSI